MFNFIDTQPAFEPELMNLYKYKTSLQIAYDKS